MRRRALLATLGSAAALSGCNGVIAPDRRSPRSPTGTTATDCTVRGSRPEGAPSFPDRLTRGRAEAFATAFEEARARAEARSDGWTVHRVEEKRVERVEAIDGGYRLRAVLVLGATKPLESPTATLNGDLPHAGWYRITDRRAERAPAFEEHDDPEKDWTTVACP